MTGYVVDHLFACNLNQFGLGCTPSRHWAREFGQVYSRQNNTFISILAFFALTIVGFSVCIVLSFCSAAFHNGTI